MSDMSRREIPGVRINSPLSPPAQKSGELPLNGLAVGKFKHCREMRPLSERVNGCPNRTPALHVDWNSYDYTR